MRARGIRGWQAAALAGAALPALGLALLWVGNASAQRRGGGAGRHGHAAGAGQDGGTSGAAGTSGTSGAAGGPGQATRRTHCPGGMLLVDGQYCNNASQECRTWLDQAEPGRCQEFFPSRCSGGRRHISVCVDEFEYPNRRGAFPQVMVSWYGARRACEAQGKRLCTMAEWTFACEGEQMLPYTTGLVRDPSACNYDHQRVFVNRGRLGNPATAADEAARAYEAAASGQYDRCVSPFGIHDMNGNADEWTMNETGVPFHSALKGGWWGPIRARCRPATLAHNEGFVYYQIGFRCCSDPT